MLHELVSRLVRHRAIALVVLLGGTAAMGFFASGLSVDNSIEAWFVEDDPTLASYEAFLEEFGNDELVVIAIRGPEDAFSPGRLARLTRLTAALEEIDGVARVQSLANAGVLLPGDAPRLTPAVDLPVGFDDVLRARAVVAIDGTASRLVGSDGATLVVLTWMAAGRDIDRERPRILRDIRSAASGELAPGEHASLGGIGVLHDALNRATIREGGLFIGLSYVVIAVALLLITRRWLWTVLALLVVTAADVALLGVMALLDRPVNMITMAVPPVVLILGVANVIHMSTDLDSALAKGRRSLPELRSALAGVAAPCAFNALTTAAAFLSLTTASMAVTRDYGLFAAIGVAFAFAFSVAGMSVLLPRASRLAPPAASAARLGSAVERVMTFSLRNRAAIILLTLVVGIASAVGASRIVVDTWSIGFLPPDDVARLDAAEIEATAGPYFPLEFTVRAPGDAWQDLEFLAAVADVQVALEADGTIGRTTTISDVLRDIHVGTTGVREPRPWSPGGADELQASLAVLRETGNRDVLDAFVGSDGRTLRLTATAPAMSVRGFTRLAERSREAADAASRGRAEVSPSGYLPLYSRIIDSVVADQVRSFGLAFLVVFLVLTLALRSWRFSLAAIPPNLLPVAILLGVMGFAGIRLDIATVTVAAVVLGVIVDDTVHILHRLRRELATGAELEAAIRVVARGSGLAVVSTSLVFVAGFLVISLSASDAVGRSGLLMGIAVLAALATDLLLLPAFVSLLFEGRRVAS